MLRPDSRTPHRVARVLLAGALAVMSAAGVALQAQDPPVNSSQVGRFDEAGSAYADVWADGNIAFVARTGQRFVDIVDISVPSNSVKIATYDTGQGASAQDVKAAGGLLFIGLEGGSPGGQIVDVRDPANPAKLTDINVRNNIHNVFYDQGWLYLADSSQPEVDVIDLRGYDPDAPPASIDTVSWRVTNIGTVFVHDITVQNGRLYAAAWDSGIWVYDVTANATQAPALLGSAPGNNVHSSWATDDGQFLVVAEERTGGGLTLFEVAEQVGSVTLTARDTLVLDAARAGSVHNPLILGNRIFASWYQAGIVAIDIDRVAGTMTEVASFDTSASTGAGGGFGGCWGAYPFLGENRILGTDISNGLFVLDFSTGTIFTDGFEAGDTTAWSQTVGPP